MYIFFHEKILVYGKKSTLLSDNILNVLITKYSLNENLTYKSIAFCKGSVKKPFAKLVFLGYYAVKRVIFHVNP